MATTRLTVTVDTTHVEDLTRRVREAVADALHAARRSGQQVDAAPVIDLTAHAVMAEILRVTPQPPHPDTAAVARVRALAERWQYTGDRKGGPLPELRAALAQQAGDDTTEETR